MSADLTTDTARLGADGRWFEAIDVLTERNRVHRDPDVEQRLAYARHRAFGLLDPVPRMAEWPPPVPDLFPDVEGPAEIPARELTVEHLRSAITHHGALLVRGMFSEPVMERLRNGIDRAFDGFDANAEGAPVEETAPWFVPFECGPGYEMDPIEQLMLHAAGGVHTGDSPRTLFDLIEALTDNGVRDLIEAHLGERPVMSLNKGVLRKVLRANPTWHQDGCYLGEDIRAMNLWFTLTECGGDTDAPGLDVMPQRIGRLLPGGTHGAVHPQAIGHAVVEEAGGDVVWCRPHFQAGDALMFDQVFVHSTDKRQGLGTLRHAIETWFFTASTFPDSQIPIVV